jgi:hypothetical protein
MYDIPRSSPPCCTLVVESKVWPNVYPIALGAILVRLALYLEDGGLGIGGLSIPS